MTQTFTDFAEAAEAKTEGFVISGTLLKSGEPVYFLTPAEEPEDVARKTAFEIREGRPVSHYEDFLFGVAQKLQAPE